MAGYIYAPAVSEEITRLRAMIKPDHLSSYIPRGKQGLEDKDPYVTLYWGVGTNNSLTNYFSIFPSLALHVQEFLKARKQPLCFITGHVVLYEARNWSILVVEALENHPTTKVLKDLNESIQKSFDFRGSEFPFKPHITLAYVCNHEREYAYNLDRELRRDKIMLNNVYLGIQGYDWRALLYTQEKDNEDGKEKREKRIPHWTHNRR